MNGHTRGGAKLTKLSLATFILYRQLHLLLAQKMSADPSPT